LKFPLEYRKVGNEDAYSIPAASILRFEILVEAKYAAPKPLGEGGLSIVVNCFEASSLQAHLASEFGDKRSLSRRSHSGEGGLRPGTPIRLLSLQKSEVCEILLRLHPAVRDRSKKILHRFYRRP
jgi:hypothetical protein